MNFLGRIIISSILILVLAYLLPAVHISEYLDALVVAVLLSFLNVTLKPILTFLTIPITIITFGLFLLVINVIVMVVVDWLVEGFYIENFLWTFIFSVFLSIAHSVFIRK